MKTTWRNLFHSRDKPKNSLGSAFSFLFGGTTSGKTVTEHTALQTTAVYACVRILAETIAGLPLHIFSLAGTYIIITTKNHR